MSFGIWCFQKQKNNEKKGIAKSTLVKVKNRYKDVDDYIETYEPLIFEEAKSQIIKQKEEEEGIFNFNYFFVFWEDYYSCSSNVAQLLIAFV